MTIRHLKIFITVYDCGKMRKAAELLYISQPCVSQAIKDLEEHYKVKLFERLSNKIYITDAGKLLLPYARHIVDSFEYMQFQVSNINSHPKLRVGGSVSVGTCILNDIIKKVEDSIDNIDVFATINNTSEIEKLILKSELDVAIVEGLINNPEIMQIPIYDDELVMVCGCSHPFYSMNNLQLECLNGQSFVSRENGSSDRNQFEQFLTENNIEIVRKWNCTNTEAIKNAVINGIGIAILSKLLVEKEVSQGSMKILHFEGVHINRKFKLIYHKNKFISHQVQCFIDICCKNAQ